MQTALILYSCVASQGVYHEAIFHLYQVQLVWTELPGGSLNFQSGFCFGGYSSAQARLHHCVYLNRKIRAWEDQSPEQRSDVCWAKTDWDTSRGPGTDILTMQSHVVRDNFSSAGSGLCWVRTLCVSNLFIWKL